MKYVVDTSVAVKLFLPEDGQEKAGELFDLAGKGKIALIAPILLIYELNNSLILNKMPATDRGECMTLLLSFVDVGVLELIQPSKILLQKSGEIADIDTKSQGYVSSYDASFHALAVQLDAIFVTADEKHYRKTKDAVGSVMLLEELET